MSGDPRSFAAAMPTDRVSAGTPLTETLPRVGSLELARALADVRGQAQFFLYLADQIEECLEQLAGESDTGNAAFLCKLMQMYTSQLETKHQGLGEKVAETCHEVYQTIRDLDLDE
jgi:hypothetical protein